MAAAHDNARQGAQSMKIGNLYHNIPGQLPQELVESLGGGKGVRIERIVSKGHRSAAGFWYDQAENEWVTLLKGAAGLRFERDDRELHLCPGMYVDIPAHERHRVEWTSEVEETVWLAVFY
jgi:cupin 2 domain-containing protein